MLHLSMLAAALTLSVSAVTAQETSRFGCTFDAEQPSNLDDYYPNLEGLSAGVLRSELNRTLRANATEYSYSDVWGLLMHTDEDPCRPGYIVLIYTGRSHDANDRDRGGRGSDRWNREHVWPKSHGFPGRSQKAYTDIHHLRPADRSVNTSRNNRDFANGGKPQGEAPNTYRSKKTWEPRDEVKGDVARMMFYMDVRYEGGEDTGDLRLVRGLTRSNTPRLGRLCTLLSWHDQDPVDDWERRRNNRIHERQGNRNPFVDHPELAKTLFGDTC